MERSAEVRKMLFEKPPTWIVDGKEVGMTVELDLALQIKVIRERINGLIAEERVLIDKQEKMRM
jgi:hypothetical protein